MKEINIFISSTFKDMDAERDLVVSVLKPEIESALNFRHVNASVNIIDLRWGVNTQDIPEEERENKVLSECLDYIRTSRPFFIGFIGDRYGWVPPQDRWAEAVASMTDREKAQMGDDIASVRSVTELEMLFGVLNDRDALPGSFFFLRKPEVYDMMDSVSRAVFCDSDSSSRTRLDALRRKVRDTYRSNGYYDSNVIDYDCSWNGSSLVVDENAVRKIVPPLVQMIMSEVILDEAECTALDDIISADMSLVEKRCSYYVPDRKFTGDILSSIESSSSPLVVRAEDGMGKTSLMAWLYCTLSEDKRYIPLVHFSSKSGYNSTCEVMLKKFLRSLPVDGGPEPPLSVEAHPGLLMKYLAGLSGNLSGRVVLLIDNVRYLRDLKLILADLSESKSFSVILTTDVPIGYLRDGVNASYMEIPCQTPDTTGQIAGLFMKASHKSLPSRVVDSLVEKKSDSGGPACGCPLWTILTLNRLLCLDLNDFARMRSISNVDDAEKITIYLQDVIRDMPSSVTLLPDYLSGTFESDEEISLSKLLLEDIKSGYTSLDRLRNLYAGTIPLLSFQKIKKTFEPLLTEDYLAGVVKLDNNILTPDTVKTVSTEPVDESSLVDFLFNKAVRLVQVLDVISEYGTEQVHDVFYSELQTVTALFDEQTVNHIAESAKSNPWPDLPAIFEDRNPVNAFNGVMEKFRASGTKDGLLLLCVAWWHLANQCRSYLETVKDENTFSKMLSILDSAFMAMNVINQKSLSAILADSLYFDARAVLENRFRRNPTGAMHYSALREQMARILYENCPHSLSIEYLYASCLDENCADSLNCGATAAQQKRYIGMGIGKSALSIRLFEHLLESDPSDGRRLDLYMAKVRRTVMLQSAGSESALEWNEKVMDEMQPFLSIPGMTEQYAFACDYQARCLLNADRTGDALEQIEKAIGILRGEYSEHPGNAPLMHSMATMLKYRADIMARNHSLTEDAVEEFRKYALIPLESNPNDSLALTQLLMAQVMDMYCRCVNGNTDGIYELTVQTLQLMDTVLTSGNNVRHLETNYFIPAFRFVLRNVTAEQYDELASLYSHLRTELINRRLITPEYIPANPL